MFWRKKKKESLRITESLKRFDNLLEDMLFDKKRIEELVLKYPDEDNLKTLEETRAIIAETYKKREHLLELIDFHKERN